MIPIFTPLPALDRAREVPRAPAAPITYGLARASGRTRRSARRRRHPGSSRAGPGPPRGATTSSPSTTIWKRRTTSADGETAEILRATRFCSLRELGEISPARGRAEVEPARLDGGCQHLARRDRARKRRRLESYDDLAVATSGVAACVGTNAKVAAREAASRSRARTVRVMVRTGRCGRVDYHSRPRGCGGIGRRARFRSVWGKPRGGSSPLIRIAHPLGPRRARQGPGRSQTGSAAGNALARAAGIRAGKRRAKEAVFGLVSHGFVPRRDRDSRPPQSAFDVGTMSSRRRLLPSSPRPSGVLRRRGGHFSPGELDVAAGPA